MVRTGWSLLGSIAVGLGAIALTGCSDNEPTQEPSACVVVGCDCSSDLDCDPALTCNTTIGLCSVRSGGSDDAGGTSDTGAETDSGMSPDAAADIGADTPVTSDADPEVAIPDFRRACDDACTTYGRCNDGDDQRCVEVCSTVVPILAELAEQGLGERCADDWTTLAACVSERSQSCNSVEELFEIGFEVCADGEDPACFGVGDDEEGSGDAP